MTAVRSTIATLVVELISVWQQSQGWQKRSSPLQTAAPDALAANAVRASGRTQCLASSVSSVMECSGRPTSCTILNR